MLALLPVLTVALMSVTPPCDAPESAVMNFWTGDWDVTWDRGRGHDRVTRTPDGCEIEDDFDDGSGELPRTHSIWPSFGDGWAMDLLNGPFPDDYKPSPLIAFMGRPSGNDYIFEESVGSAPMYYRIVFGDIRESSFTWRWQSAPDRKTWTDRLVAHYVRSNR